MVQSVAQEPFPSSLSSTGFTIIIINDDIFMLMMMIMIMMMVIMIMIIWIMMMVFLTFYPHLLVVPFNRKLKVMHICGVAYSSSIFIAVALVLAFTAWRGNIIWYFNMKYNMKYMKYNMILMIWEIYSLQYRWSLHSLRPSWLQSPRRGRHHYHCWSLLLLSSFLIFLNPSATGVVGLCAKRSP